MGGQALLALDGLVGGVPHGTADTDRVVVPQEPPHFPDDHGDAVGGELHALGHVKIVDSLDEANAPHLEQIVRVLPAAAEPLDHAEHQPQIAGNQLFSCVLVPGVAFHQQLPHFGAFEHLQAGGVHAAYFHFSLHENRLHPRRQKKTTSAVFLRR